MSAYEYILTLDTTTLDDFIRRGIFRPKVKRDFERYKYYLSQCYLYSKMQAITNTSEKFDISEETVFRLIRKMK